MHFGLRRPIFVLHFKPFLCQWLINNFSLKKQNEFATLRRMLDDVLKFSHLSYHISNCFLLFCALNSLLLSLSLSLDRQLMRTWIVVQLILIRLTKPFRCSMRVYRNFSKKFAFHIPVWFSSGDFSCFFVCLFLKSLVIKVLWTLFIEKVIFEHRRLI